MFKYTKSTPLGLRMTRSTVITLFFVLSWLGNGLCMPVTIDFNGTFDRTETLGTIQGLMPGEKFFGTMTYDYELASNLVGTKGLYVETDIADALTFTLNFGGYTARFGGTEHNGFTWLFGAEFWCGGEGGYYFTPIYAGLEPLYFEYVGIVFSYNDGLVHDVAAAPDPDKFALTHLNISGGPLFSADGAINATPNPVPEPSTVLLLFAGLSGVGFLKLIHRLKVFV